MLTLDYRRDRDFDSRWPLIKRILDGREIVYIFGTTRYSVILNEYFKTMGITVAGFIDDMTSEQSFQGLPIVKLSGIDQDVTIVSSVIEGRPKSVRNHLRGEQFEKIVNYFDFNYLDSSRFPIPFNTGNYEKIKSNFSRLQRIYDRLEDDLSRETLQTVLDARINFDHDRQKMEYNLSSQYFEDFIGKDQIVSFVDAGGYDGSTTLRAKEVFRNLSRIYYIEPSPDGMNASRKRLAALKGCSVEFFETALSSEDRTTFMTTGKGGANHLMDDGEVMTKVSTLDSLIDKQVDYIKLDIEGEEVNALKGARRLITEYKPSLAVCIYHEQNHFWEIPSLLMAMNPTYRIYVRHYTEGIFETVMYFI